MTQTKAHGQRGADRGFPLRGMPTAVPENKLAKLMTLRRSVRFEPLISTLMALFTLLQRSRPRVAHASILMYAPRWASDRAHGVLSIASTDAAPRW